MAIAAQLAASRQRFFLICLVAPGSGAHDEGNPNRLSGVPRPGHCRRHSHPIRVPAERVLNVAPQSSDFKLRHHQNMGGEGCGLAGQAEHDRDKRSPIAGRSEMLEGPVVNAMVGIDQRPEREEGAGE